MISSSLSIIDLPLGLRYLGLVPGRVLSNLLSEQLHLLLETQLGSVRGALCGEFLLLLLVQHPLAGVPGPGVRSQESRG